MTESLGSAHDQFMMGTKITADSLSSAITQPCIQPMDRVTSLSQQPHSPTTEPRSVLDRARLGEIEAIAILINRALAPRGVEARMGVKENYYQILLEAESGAPPQSVMVAFVQQGFQKLNAAGIDRLKIYGRQKGSRSPAWRQEIILGRGLTESASLAASQIAHQPKSRTSRRKGCSSANLLEVKNNPPRPPARRRKHRQPSLLQRLLFSSPHQLRGGRRVLVIVERQRLMSNLTAALIASGLGFLLALCLIFFVDMRR